ncbi:putative rab-like protein 2A isoform X2 [Apostichopus japonicus]|uniref:Putative rab-like protein 2A isoform X2 n=1 Tax=Stichopus japonicus TaxID=307972 RepID=A0A2G8LDX5_STIJA|nr:putative rab-like protein 2A isoform X2 [Apostichopus japonicus]
MARSFSSIYSRLIYSNSKLVDVHQPQQLSTYALTLFRYETKVNSEAVTVAFWDTAGQERFSSLHPSYYHKAHACILVFDVTRKITYKNLPTWYKELREYRPEIPCLLAANKIDVDYKVTQKTFHFGKKYNMPFYFVSAADGTNVVKLFREAINMAHSYKANPTDFMDEVLQELEGMGDLKLSPDSGLDTAPDSEGKDGDRNNNADEESEGASGTS